MQMMQKPMTIEEISDRANTRIAHLFMRMVFVESRPTGKARSQIFPAFLQEEHTSKKNGKSWIIAIVQRIEGSIEMVKIRFREKDIGEKIRLWDCPPTRDDIEEAGEWPEAEPEKREDRGEPGEHPEQTGTDGGESHGGPTDSLQQGAENCGEGAPGGVLGGTGGVHE